MALSTLFSLLTPSARGKGINSVLNLDTQFNTGSAVVTTLPANSNLIFTTLDAPAEATGYQAIGFNILDGHTLNLGAGNDNLQVSQGLALDAIGVKIGIGGKLDMGAGKNKLLVTLTGAGSVGINNQSKFLGGAGLDSVGADAIKNGIVNGSSTNTTALIDMGAGGDRISATSETGHGIENYGTINMGLSTQNDKDVLTGGSAGHFGLTPAYTEGKFGIFNSGTINMGGGKDVIDALVGGFGGNGVYNLGWTRTVGNVTTQDTDADAVLGFGSGTFNGGGGRNSITLPDGTYEITYTVKPLTLTSLASGSLTRNGDLNTVMNFNQFDGIGGDGLNGALHFVFAPPLGVASTLANFTVDAAGDISAVTYV